MTREEMQALVAEHGGIAAAARAIGMPRTTFRDRLHAAESTLYRETGPNGEPILQWVKYPQKRDAERDEALIEAVREIVADMPSFSPTLAPAPSDEDLMTVYVLADHHLMMLAWGAETGDNYDLKIAEAILKDTVSRLVAATPSSDVGVLLNLGDFFHANDNNARTPKHGNPLDVDGRYPKALLIGLELHIWMVQALLQKHKTVEVRVLPGNHDPEAAVALAVAIAAAFRNEPRVVMDLSPDLFYFKQWGETMVAAHHGHLVKGPEMPGVMASYRPEMWGSTRHRYAYLGHIHHKSVGGNEAHGARWETFQTLAAKDAFNYGLGFSSGRSMTAITLHRSEGEDSRVIRHVREKFYG